MVITKPAPPPSYRVHLAQEAGGGGQAFDAFEFETQMLNKIDEIRFAVVPADIERPGQAVLFPCLRHGEEDTFRASSGRQS